MPIKKEVLITPRGLNAEGYGTEVIELIARQAELRMGSIYHKAKDKSPIYCAPIQYRAMIANNNRIRFVIEASIGDEEFEEICAQYEACFRLIIKESGLFIRQIIDNHAKIKGMQGEIDQLYHALKDRTDKLEEQTKAMADLSKSVKEYTKKISRKSRRV